MKSRFLCVLGFFIFTIGVTTESVSAQENKTLLVAVLKADKYGSFNLSENNFLGVFASNTHEGVPVLARRFSHGLCYVGDPNGVRPIIEKMVKNTDKAQKNNPGDPGSAKLQYFEMRNAKASIGLSKGDVKVITYAVYMTSEHYHLDMEKQLGAREIYPCKRRFIPKYTDK